MLAITVALIVGLAVGWASARRHYRRQWRAFLIRSGRPVQLHRVA